MKQTMKTGLAALVLLLAISCKKENSSMLTLSNDDNGSAQNVVTDDKVLAGNTVTIGTQVWMNSNLKTKFYRNGEPIPQVTDPTAWAALTTGAWCWYNNDSATYAETYGKLYNWYAVHDPRGLAPAGSHIPSYAEWDTLSSFLGRGAGGRMKSTGTIEAGTGLWYSPNKYATNVSGFTGLPGGDRADNGPFINVGYYGYWWSASEFDSNSAWYRDLHYKARFLFSFYASKKLGFSVRCVKD